MQIICLSNLAIILQIILILYENRSFLILADHFCILFLSIILLIISLLDSY